MTPLGLVQNVTVLTAKLQTENYNFPFHLFSHVQTYCLPEWLVRETSSVRTVSSKLEYST